MCRKKIKLGCVVGLIEPNGYYGGLLMKRDLSVKEACHIYRNILLLNIDLSLEELDEMEKKEYRIRITNALNDYIIGKLCWRDVCESACCLDDEETAPSIGACLRLIEYLQQHEILV